MILVDLQSAHHFTTVGLAEVMVQKFTIRDYSLVSPSVTSSVHFKQSEQIYIQVGPA